MAGEALVSVTRMMSINGVQIGGAVETVAADFQALYKQTVATGATNWEVDIPITVANLEAFGIFSTQAVTVKTNSTTVPTQTITVPANTLLMWTNAQPSGQNILTADTTKFFITNASGIDAQVSIGFAAKQAPSGTV